MLFRSNAIDAAALDATSKANAAESAAESAAQIYTEGWSGQNADVTDYAAAAATAQQKADDAQTAAESYTNIREQAMIDGVITDAEQNAIDAAALDATNKANFAESAAESAAKDYTDAVVKKLATNAYAGTVDADGYATGDKVASLIFELSGTSSWPETYGGVVTHWYAAERATQICFGTSGDVEYTREVHPSSYPNWSSWKKKEVYNSSDVNSLLTLNGPAQAGADVTDYAAAAATAQEKADAAEAAAQTYTNVREQAMIDGVITDAEQGAIDAAAIDATNKANAAESAAESAAQLYTEGWSGQNADVTGDNTAANTNAVAGTAATTVRDNAAMGNSAKSVTNNWTRPGQTLIDGNKIFTGDAYVDTLQIAGNAVTLLQAQTGGSSMSYGDTVIQSFNYDHGANGNVPVLFTFGATVSYAAGNGGAAGTIGGIALEIDGATRYSVTVGGIDALASGAYLKVLSSGNHSIVLRYIGGWDNQGGAKKGYLTALGGKR